MLILYAAAQAPPLPSYPGSTEQSVTESFSTSQDDAPPLPSMFGKSRFSLSAIQAAYDRAPSVPKQTLQGPGVPTSEKSTSGAAVPLASILDAYTAHDDTESQEEDGYEESHLEISLFPDDEDERAPMPPPPPSFM